MRDDRVRLGDILEALKESTSMQAKGVRRFHDDELIQTWVVHHLMIIGEACRALSPEFRAAHPEDVWALAGGLRNVIVHEYFWNRSRNSLGCDQTGFASPQRSCGERYWQVRECRPLGHPRKLRLGAGNNTALANRWLVRDVRWRVLSR